MAEDLNEFKKVQVKITLKLPVDQKINIISIEMGYPDSYGDIIWKSSGRIFDDKLQKFLKMQNRGGNEIDVIMPSSWSDFQDDKKTFIFDFVKNDKNDKIKLREDILNQNDKLSEHNEYEIAISETSFSTKYIEINISEKFIGTD
jgi:hypothetical protein